jgi:hypothetical protein
MCHPLVPVLALALLGGADAAPEVVNFRPTYGYNGAARPKPQGMLPGDAACFSFEIKNLKQDANGRVNYSIGIVITDGGGKVLFEQKPYNSVAQMFFGGTTLPAAARIDVPLDSKPGPTHWKVTITDRTTGKTTVKEGEGKILPADFGLVQVGTFADLDGKVPTAPVGVVGSQLHLEFGVVGFARGKDSAQPDLDITLKIVDDKGKPTLAKPLTTRIQKDIPTDLRFLPMQFALTLDRVGNYSIELTAQDKISGKTSSVPIPVRILAGQ